MPPTLNNIYIKFVKIVMQYTTTQLKIFTNHEIEVINFHYTDYIDAEKCYNRLIRNTYNEKKRYYNCAVAVNDRTRQRKFKGIKANN